MLPTMVSYKRIRQTQAQMISDQLQAELKKVRYLYKDLTYRFEQECRFVETPDSVAEKGIPLEFDYSGTQGTEVVKKYIDHPSLKLTANILDSKSKITLGPLVPNPVHTKEYIERLLRCGKIFWTTSPNLENSLQNAIPPLSWTSPPRNSRRDTTAANWARSSGKLTLPPAPTS